MQNLECVGLKYIEYSACYGYADWSLSYLLRFGLLGLMVGLCHNFCILSQLVWLERVRNRRKDTLILQGESRTVQNV